MNKIQSRLLLSAITALGLFLRLCIINANKFLHSWDERYHALVAKHLIDSPLTPLLYTDPALPYTIENWSGNHIWLHKQPLFMWQIAASIWAFGAEAFAVRLPSTIMGTLLIVITYHIAKRWLKRTDIALLSAFLIATSNYQLELTSGNFGIEHNDVAFGFYVAASLWALTRYLTKEYKGSGQLKWAILIGLFSGLAILTKWLTGLLVFSGWGVAALLTYRQHNLSVEVRNGAVALLVAVVIAAPWQYYIITQFPKEASQAYAHNRLHITEVVEGHNGSIFYYFSKAYKQYGLILWLLVPLGVYYANKLATPSRRVTISLIASSAILTRCTVASG